MDKKFVIRLGAKTWKMGQGFPDMLISDDVHKGWILNEVHVLFRTKKMFVTIYLMHVLRCSFHGTLGIWEFSLLLLFSECCSTKSALKRQRYCVKNSGLFLWLVNAKTKVTWIIHVLFRQSSEEQNDTVRFDAKMLAHIYCIVNCR